MIASFSDTDNVTRHIFSSDDSESSLDTWEICAISQQLVQRDSGILWRGSPVYQEYFSELK